VGESYLSILLHLVEDEVDGFIQSVWWHKNQGLELAEMIMKGLYGKYKFSCYRLGAGCSDE
jgi:hypothetical protein